MTNVPSPTPSVVVAPVTSAWASKINWTQLVAGAAMFLTFVSGGKMNLTPEQQAAIITSIGVAANIATWIMKTWFTKSITASSAK